MKKSQRLKKTKRKICMQKVARKMELNKEKVDKGWGKKAILKTRKGNKGNILRYVRTERSYLGRRCS